MLNPIIGKVKRPHKEIRDGNETGIFEYSVFFISKDEFEI